MWTITWTRDPGGGTPLPLVLDCFRAQPSRAAYAPLAEAQGIMRVTLTIPALPYGRSDKRYSPGFTAPVPQTPSPPPPRAPVVLDNYSTISGPQFFQSTRCVIGPHSACWDPDGFGDPGGQVTQLTYSASFPSPLDLTGMTSLQMWLGLGSRYYPYLEYQGKTHGVSVAVTLKDTSGEHAVDVPGQPAAAGDARRADPGVQPGHASRSPAAPRSRSTRWPATS